MNHFISDQRGNVAVIFSLALLPLMGLTGAALDYSRTADLKEELRAASDQLAITVAAADNPFTAPLLLAAARENLRESLGDRVQDVSVTGSWIDSANYEVRIEASLRTALLAAVPAMPNPMRASVRSVSNRIPPTWRVLPPDMSMLDPEAGDYNRIYMYCFDPSRVHEEDKGRRDFVAIADNSSTTVFDADLPECGAGEFVSYKLRNVRGARQYPNRWDDPSREVYEYYTDTIVDPNTRVLEHNIHGYRVHNGSRWDAIDMEGVGLIETTLCRDMSECKERRHGGVIPNPTRNRTPEQATEACEEGQFMYFGWEDRPVYPKGHPRQNDWTDADFDDIRLIVSCPEIITTNRIVRLVE